MATMMSNNSGFSNTQLFGSSFHPQMFNVKAGLSPVSQVPLVVTSSISEAKQVELLPLPLVLFLEKQSRRHSGFVMAWPANTGSEMI